jgi:hypothetical protein
LHTRKVARDTSGITNISLYLLCVWILEVSSSSNVFPLNFRYGLSGSDGFAYSCSFDLHGWSGAYGSDDFESSDWAVWVGFSSSSIFSVFWMEFF